MTVSPAPWNLRRLTASYRFVDYSTQAYSTIVAMVLLALHNETVPSWRWLLAGHLAILPLVHWLAVVRTKKPGPILWFLSHFYPIFLYTPFFCESGWLNRMLFPAYLDPIAIRADQALFGFQPSIQFMERFPYLLLSEIFYASYFSYYIMIAGVGLALFIRSRTAFLHFVSVVSFVFYVCYFLYVLIPVIGPRVFLSEINGYVLPETLRGLAPLSSYPAAVESGPFYLIMKWVYRVFESPGAAFPSSHVAVAICTVFFSFRYLPRIRLVHLVMATLLCLSTIYCRYHYAVDVIAGVITAAILVPLGSFLYFRFERSEVPPPPLPSVLKHTAGRETL